MVVRVVGTAAKNFSLLLACGMALISLSFPLFFEYLMQENDRLPEAQRADGPEMFVGLMPLLVFRPVPLVLAIGLLIFGWHHDKGVRASNWICLLVVIVAGIGLFLKPM